MIQTTTYSGFPHLRVVIAAIFALLLTSSGCRDTTPGSGQTTTDTTVEIPRARRLGLDTTSTPGYYPPVDTTPGADPNMRADTLDGTLQLKASGGLQGEWKFYSVIASLDEEVRAGQTHTTLQYEAHRVAPEVHFKFRLVSSGGSITSGTYKLNSQGDVRVQGAFDADGRSFRNLGRGSDGSVTVDSIGRRLVGSFDITLAAIADSGKPVRLTGSFAQKIEQ